MPIKKSNNPFRRKDKVRSR